MQLRWRPPTKREDRQNRAVGRCCRRGFACWIPNLKAQICRRFGVEGSGKPGITDRERVVHVRGGVWPGSGIC